MSPRLVGILAMDRLYKAVAPMHTREMPGDVLDGFGMNKVRIRPGVIY
jgi:hypothetical protein